MFTNNLGSSDYQTTKVSAFIKVLKLESNRFIKCLMISCTSCHLLPYQIAIDIVRVYFVFHILLLELLIKSKALRLCFYNGTQRFSSDVKNGAIMPPNSFPLQVQFNKNLNGQQQKSSCWGASSLLIPFVIICRIIVWRALASFYMKLKLQNDTSYPIPKSYQS